MQSEEVVNEEQHSRPGEEPQVLTLEQHLPPQHLPPNTQHPSPQAEPSLEQDTLPETPDPPEPPEPPEPLEPDTNGTEVMATTTRDDTP